MVKELIGATIEIVDAANKSLIGKKGKVIDETKNTITLENKKIILKNSVTIQIGENIIHGNTITKRPYERIKG